MASSQPLWVRANIVGMVPSPLSAPMGCGAVDCYCWVLPVRVAGTCIRVVCGEGGVLPVVMVAGVPKPFSEVTEEDTSKMSDAEYQIYFDMMRE